MSALAERVDVIPLPALDHMPAREFQWWTPEYERVVRSPVTIRKLVEHIGSMPGWEWLTIQAHPEGPYAQACGDARHGLAVEVSPAGDAELVAPAGADIRPRTDIGMFGWHFLANTEELHTPGEAFAIMTDWLYDATIDPAFELRPVRGRGRNWS